MIKILVGDQLCYAALHENGRWTSNNADAGRMLNDVFAPDDTEGPAAGPYGEREVNRVVKDYQGRVIWKRPVENISERIY